MDDTVLEISENRHNNAHHEYHRKRNHTADDFIFLENDVSEV